MTDIPKGSPMERASLAAETERSTSLLDWLFSRDETSDSRWFSGIPPTIHRCELIFEKGHER